jgi:3-oxoadipate enol-lactonase
MPYVRTRLGRFFYEDRGAPIGPGDRPAIVLLHGLLFDGGMWRAQVEELSALGRVVVFDGPGHGKSDPPPRFTLEEHADAMHDALGELGIAHAVVVGHSWGAMTAMRLALQHPERVRGLALVDTSAVPEPLDRRVRYRAFVSLHRRVGFPRALFDREIAPLLFAPQTLVVRPDLVSASYRRAMGFDREGVARSSLAAVVHRSDVHEAIAKIRVPCVVLCGREDRATPVARSEQIATAIGGSELWIVEGAGHMSPLEQPTAVNQRLVGFVERLAG